MPSAVPISVKGAVSSSIRGSALRDQGKGDRWHDEHNDRESSVD